MLRWARDLWLLYIVSKAMATPLQACPPRHDFHAISLKREGLIKLFKIIFVFTRCMCNVQTARSLPSFQGSTSDLSTPAHSQPDVGMLRKNTSLIYVYNLPAKFNQESLALQPTWHSDSYDYDVLVHKHLLSSHLRTHDPDAATLFYLPLYLSRRINWVFEQLEAEVSWHRVLPLRVCPSVKCF